MLSFRPGLAAHAGIDHDDLWIDLSKCLVVELETLGGSGREVLYDDIGPFDHAMRDGEALWVREVEGDAEF